MAISKVTIDGLHMDGPEGQAWEFARGAGTPQVPFVVSEKLDALIQGIPVGKPVPLAFEGVHFEGRTKKIETKIEVKGLYLTRRHSTLVRGHRVRWFIADVRLFFQKLWVFSEFNMRRPINEFKEFGVGLQRFFNRAPKFSYLVHSLRSSSANEFALGDDELEKAQPWTAFQAVQWLLDGFLETEAGRIHPPGLGSNWKPTVDISRATDNGRVLVEQRTNKPWPFVMQKFLDQAHLGLYVDHNANFVLYDLSDADLADRVGGYRGGGVPVLQDARRLRPRRVRVFFRTEREVRFDYFETATGVKTSNTLERGKRDMTLGLRNVLILPQDVKEVSSGRVFQRGSIVEIQKALELWNQDPDNPPPALLSPKGKSAGTVAFNLDFIRKNIMSPAMATKMTLMPRFSNSKDQVFAARASALYKSYRQVFQLPLAWLEMIDGIRAERTAVQDPITGKRSPSPVWMDYFTEFSGRYFQYKSSPKNLAGGMNVYAWDSSNPTTNPNGKDLRTNTTIKDLKLTIGNVAPAGVSFVNKRQGVFRISFLPDLYGNSVRQIPAVFEKIPVTFLGGRKRTWLTSQMEYDPTWRLSTVLTLSLRTPNNHKKLHFVDYSKKGADPTKQTAQDAAGPNHEVLFSSLHAGFTWDDDTSKVETGPDGVRISGGKLANADVLEDAADAILEDVKFKTADAVVGEFRGPGFDLARDFLQGSVSSIRIEHTSGKIQTAHDMKTPPVAPPFFTLLPTSSANFLYRIGGEPDQ